MQANDLRIYLLLICLPAAVLTGLGLFFLHRQSAAAAAREREIGAAQAARFMAEVQDVAEEAARLDSDACRAALLALRAGEDSVAPRGAFAWAARKGVLWSEGLSPRVADELARKTYLRDWTDGSPAAAKRPPRRSRFVVGADDAACHVFWARSGARDGFVCGVVFDGDPVAASSGVVRAGPVAAVLVVLLACVLGFAAWLMARAAAKARRDDAAKTSFVSNVSHELKTPLAGIGLWTELLQRNSLSTDAARAHAYDVIAGENARMVRLVENLLDFSRLEKGRRTYHIEAVDMVRLAGEVVELVRGDFAAHGVDLRAEGDCRACADADAVKQILVNLLGNAAKYAAAGGPVEVSVAAADGVARLAVADRGPGLSAAARARVFERFYRADDALNAKTSGLGLGLSISQALARDMGGSLSVAPRTGGGCVFTLELMEAEEGRKVVGEKT